ncbi:hypothetical protein HDU76_006193 [Blyttiomyces sp. JEL0837]|nr:hypothetical protein HDU76_006193 [Blyttiomyces sp. JEL0837]
MIHRLPTLISSCSAARPIAGCLSSASSITARLSVSSSPLSNRRTERFYSKPSTPPKTFTFPVHRFEPHATLEHPLHGSTAEDAPQPVIVVMQEWWGINEQIKSHAQRIANNTGAIALVPDLYNGKSTVDAEEASHLMNNLDWQKALNELESLVLSHQTVDGSELKRKMGTVGFCMGGALSLAIAARMAKVGSPLQACVSFYGTPSPALIDISKIPLTTPVQAHFGELDDMKGFSDADTAHKLADTWGLTIKRAGGPHAHGLHSLESNVYLHHDVGHAFMNEIGKGLDDVRKKEIDNTWKKVFAFFIEHLKSV